LTPELISAAEKKLKVKLPAAYIEVLQVTNGGDCKEQFSTIDGQEVELTGLAGILDEESEDGILAQNELAHDEWEVPKWLIPFSVNDGHVWMCFDYRKPAARSSGDVPIVSVQDDEVTEISADFDTFVEKLLAGGGEDD